MVFQVRIYSPMGSAAGNASFEPFQVQRDDNHKIRYFVRILETT